MRTSGLLACHDCDLLHRRRPLRPGAKARCGRCGALLYAQGKDVVDRTLAYALAALVLFLVTNAFPFMDFGILGRVQSNYLISGVYTLWTEGYPELGAMVAFTSIVSPALLIAILLSLTLPLKLGHRPRYLTRLAKLVVHLKPWSMMEVYLLAVIVTVVKLGALGSMNLELGSYSFIVLVFALTAALAIFDPELVWRDPEDLS